MPNFKHPSHYSGKLMRRNCKTVPLYKKEKEIRECSLTNDNVFFN